ncbi:tagaturonate reductase [Mucilaginibacter sp. FT3.2]|uniref:tagaturonate reductase n=1 Tax=Mucilaginibacter sp. FT3.2 TaxID=2723090 RepID=UPI001621FA7C|nr:tagaturonate reductase [Mucilaginibacter sp. FT3.2]MBB6230388.1 tagaturonate reductase [Mucilaginibacter sp. FT3.2]
MKLSKENLKEINTEIVQVPNGKLFDLPVKVLQFGTGVLLRGLPDYLIDKANKQGVFNGRVVVVKSTSGGDEQPFETQDGLYTLLVRGIENGSKIEENIISAAISEVLTASRQWDEILVLAANPHLKVIISNTTEVGIRLTEESIELRPPVSFPGKLLAFLHKRYQAFNGDDTKGLVIIPTELLPNNGRILRDIVLKLAAYNKLEDRFVEWLSQANFFCNSLVDRIVPGKPGAADKLAFEKLAGYEDELMVTAEAYRLWAIEGDEHIKNILSFEQIDAGVIVTPDIDLFRELKLRLLNGTHTLCCGVAFSLGFDTVKDAIEDAAFLKYIKQLMAEIAVAIPYEVAQSEAQEFATKVLDRFRNPQIAHKWINISQQYTAKVKMRVVPLLLTYHERFQKVPDIMAIGFAAYLVFMRAVSSTEGYSGNINGTTYVVADESAERLSYIWQTANPTAVAVEALQDSTLWGTDLTKIAAFAATVQHYINIILSGDLQKTITS